MIHVIRINEVKRDIELLDLNNANEALRPKKEKKKVDVIIVVVVIVKGVSIGSSSKYWPCPSKISD